MNKRVIISFFLFEIFFIPLLYSQVQQEWIRYYPDSNNFRVLPNDMVLDDSGNVYITGMVLTNTWQAFCTMKYSPSGNQIWVSNYYGISIGGREARSIALDKNSNVFVTGYTYQNSTFFDFCTIKYNSIGEQQWINFYDGLVHGEDEGEVIAVDNANNVYVSGFSQITGGHYVFTTIKYSNDGRELWAKQKHNGSASDYVNSITVDDSCSVYICGDSFDSLIIKYDSSGNVRWAQTYDSVNASFGANAVAVDSYHNAYVTGFVLGGYTFSDFLTLKYSPGGEKLWERRFNVDSTIQHSTCEARAIVLDGSSNIYISGEAGNAYSGINNFCTLKYSGSGDLLWVNRDTIQSSGTISMSIDGGNNIYLTGVYFINNIINSNITFKYAPSGDYKWSINYIDSNASPSSVKVDANNNVYVTGSKGGNANDGKLYLIKYSQPIGVRPISTGIPKDFTLYQNYPNPFNPGTVIKYQLPITSDVELTIYDVLGKKLITLVNEIQKSGKYEIKWDASNLASGIYFYRLIADQKVMTKKMVLIK